MHVLSCNNYVLIDDLFGNQSTKANCDALVAKKFDDEIGIESDENQLYKETLFDDVEDQLYFESASINDILSPNQKSQ